MTVVTGDAGTKPAGGPAFFFELGFRPFFLFAALFAGIAVPVWMAAFAHGYPVGASGDAMSWHAHEMIFGYTSAVIAGFLLTAIPNWTGRAPLSGWPLGALFGLWLAGRVAMAWPGSGVAGQAIDALFLVTLAAIVWREIVASKNWRNLPVAGLVSGIALANIR